MKFHFYQVWSHVEARIFSNPKQFFSLYVKQPFILPNPKIELKSFKKLFHHSFDIIHILVKKCHFVWKNGDIAKSVEDVALTCKISQNFICLSTFDQISIF